MHRKIRPVLICLLKPRSSSHLRGFQREKGCPNFGFIHAAGLLFDTQPANGTPAGVMSATKFR
jgi:hypothetical protein